MGKINVNFKWSDVAFEKEYSKKGEAISQNCDYIGSTYREGIEIEIEKITSVVRGEIIVDLDDPKYCSIDIQLQNVKDIDITNVAVIDFFNYLITIREKAEEE